MSCCSAFTNDMSLFLLFLPYRKDSVGNTAVLLGGRHNSIIIIIICRKKKKKKLRLSEYVNIVKKNWPSFCFTIIELLIYTMSGRQERERANERELEIERERERCV